MASQHRDRADIDNVTMVEPGSPRHESGAIKDVEKGTAGGPMVKGASKTDVTVDAVWGDVGSEGPNYRNLGWIRASVLETKTQIGLGVLGLVSHVFLRLLLCHG